MSIKKHDNDACIKFAGVDFAYSSAPVLSDVSFTVPSGDYVGVIGPNGGGKTTLLKLLLGILTPDAGEITLFGHSVREAKAHYEIGYVPQNVVQTDLAFPATVAEVVASGRTRRRGFLGVMSREDRKAIAQAIELTDITEFQNARIGELSGGQRQRAFIARALAGEPKILILDEPTVGVDIASVAQFNRVLDDLNKAGLTILLVSHDVDAVAAQVKHVLCINKEIVCHVATRQFDKAGVLRDLYGPTRQPVPHNH